MVNKFLLIRSWDCDYETVYIGHIPVSFSAGFTFKHRDNRHCVAVAKFEILL